MFRFKNSIVCLLVVTMIALGLSAPAGTSSDDYVQPPLVESYGDEPPKANARDYWSEQSQNPQVQADPINQDNDNADEGDSDSDDDHKSNSNEVEAASAPAESETHPVANSASSPKSHKIDKRSPNKRPIRYRSKNNRRRQINDDE